jgi:bisphosphoglycerate-dependent phosphoglycerate mutase
MKIKWKEGFKIKVSVDDENSVLISANQEGLLSLAAQLEALADEDAGIHIHYDEDNSLKKGSSNLIIEKID